MRKQRRVPGADPHAEDLPPMRGSCHAECGVGADGSAGEGWRRTSPLKSPLAAFALGKQHAARIAFGERGRRATRLLCAAALGECLHAQSVALFGQAPVREALRVFRHQRQRRALIAANVCAPQRGAGGAARPRPAAASPSSARRASALPRGRTSAPRERRDDQPRQFVPALAVVRRRYSPVRLRARMRMRPRSRRRRRSSPAEPPARRASDARA